MSDTTFAKPQIIPYCETSTENITLFDCKWVPSSARIVVLGSHVKGHGTIQIYSLTKDAKLDLNSQVKRPDPIKCGTFGATSLENRHLATGDFAGHLAIWDLENMSPGPIFSVKAHDQIINCIDGVAGLGIGRGAPEIVTASRDGFVKVWDPRVKDRPVACMQPKATKTNARDCWAVAFGHSHNETDRVVAAGYDNGDLKMFDLRAMSVRWETQLDNGICGLAFDRKDIEMNKLLATCLEGRIHMWDLRTFHEKKGFTGVSQKVEKGHTIWGGAFLPQNREIFMTLGGSGCLGLYKYKYPSKRTKTLDDDSVVGVIGEMEKLQEASLGDQPISGFDWSHDKNGLGVCTGFDQKIRLVICTKLNTL